MESHGTVQCDYIYSFFFKKKCLQSPCKFAGQINQLRTWRAENYYWTKIEIWHQWFLFSFLFCILQGGKDTPALQYGEARVQQSGQSELASCALYFHHLSARSQLTLIRDSENKIRISRQAPHLVMHQKMKKSEYLHSTACDAQSL